MVMGRSGHHSTTRSTLAAFYVSVALLGLGVALAGCGESTTQKQADR